MVVNKNIRFYQPNDPYYWEVDNLPLTDLLNNDIALEERIDALEDSLNDVGSSYKGSFSTTTLKDLKAYVEPSEGSPGQFGKVFVQPGKFTARMQVPASRESGWRMMRDDDDFFNNTNLNGTGGLDSNSTLFDFVRRSKGLARTAIVDFKTFADGSDQFVTLDTFDSSEFNSAQAPQERLDLIFVRGSVALDTDPSEYTPNLQTASIGVIKGAYFRTDQAASPDQKNSGRFQSPTSKVKGRVTGMAASEIPATTELPNYGSVPMPEDLANFAWHKSTATTVVEDITAQQLTTGASFCLPIAYVRVPQGYQTGTLIPQENIIDIRPFLRTAELTYNERAAVASSVRPNGLNPFVTQSHLLDEVTPVRNIAESANDVAQSAAGVAASNAAAIADLQTTTQDHEGRITVLEGGGSSGGAGGQKWAFIPPYEIYANEPASDTAKFGGNGIPSYALITPAFNGQTPVAVQFRVKMLQQTGAATEVGLRMIGSSAGGTQVVAREVCRAGIGGSGNPSGGGQINTFLLPAIVAATGEVTIGFEAVGATPIPSTVRISVYIDGYIYE